MNLLSMKYFLVIGLTILGIVMNSVSFNPIRFHCNNYILNTYLYIILSWAIVLSTIDILNANNVTLSGLFSSPLTILFALATIITIVGLLFIPPKYFISKHLLYITSMVLLGMMLYPLYVNNKSLFNYVGLTTVILVLTLSAITYIFPSLIRDSWGIYLFIGLLGIIIARFVEIILTYTKVINWETSRKWSRQLSYVSILVFVFYTMYDTKKILVNASNCINPDYINESLNIFLDSVNLFSNIYNVSGE